ncbi:ATP-grasp domain-containing protein [Actinokineospora enzanensis]|uniref:ATP-grasp domain-containing protein n=1 Tax=Actinokineospora enzanensis TaxID=155975 RepID=UPI000363D775|nr:hypothetical protein [Actinokineospora enzanensis]
MRYLVLNRTPLADRHFPAWLGEDNRAVLITAADAVSDPAQLAGYEHTTVLDDFHFNPAVELAALRLHERFGFDRVISLSEFDLLRAARLRELFGVPGQDVAGARAFRDKLWMKELLGAAGIPLVPFAPVAHLADVLGFIDRHGYPVVVKPRRGGGSEGVHVLRDETELLGYVAETRELGTDDGAQLLVESYLEHELFHVDGITVRGEVRLMWPSSQGTTSCLDLLGGTALRSALLDPDDPLLGPLRELTGRALAVLPTPEISMFHAEVFHSERHGLVFNEIACRMGGGMIEWMLRRGFGITLPEVYVRALADNSPPEFDPVPIEQAGLALVPPRPGMLMSIPAECPTAGIVDYRPGAEVGTRLAAPRNSMDKIAFLLAAGSTRVEVEKSLDGAVDWFQRTVEIG